MSKQATLLNQMATAALMEKDTSGIKDKIDAIKYAIDKRNAIDKGNYLSGTGQEFYGKLKDNQPQFDPTAKDDDHDPYKYGQIGHTFTSDDESSYSKISKIKKNANLEESDDKDHEEDEQEAPHPIVHAIKAIVIKHHDSPPEIEEHEFHQMADDVTEPEHILHAYDPEEFAVIDKDTGNPIHNLHEECTGLLQIDEILSREERMKLAIRFQQSKFRRVHNMMIALRQRSSMVTLKKRARRLAERMVKEKLAGGRPLAALSISDRETIERMMVSYKDRIAQLAIRLIPKVQMIENDRMSHQHFTRPAPSDEVPI